MIFLACANNKEPVPSMCSTICRLKCEYKFLWSDYGCPWWDIIRFLLSIIYLDIKYFTFNCLVDGMMPNFFFFRIQLQARAIQSTNAIPNCWLVRCLMSLQVINFQACAGHLSYSCFLVGLKLLSDGDKVSNTSFANV